MRTTHLITSLDADGTQRALYRLLGQLIQQGIEAEVISLRPAGEVAADFRDLGIPVRSLEMRRGVPSPFALQKLVRRLGERCPDVLVTWLYHADLLGGVAARFVNQLPVVWNVRHTRLDARDRLATRAVVRGCAWLAPRAPRQIVFCSHESKAWHEAAGYPAETSTVIGNGFNLSEFRPDVTARAEVREELGLPPETRLVGHFGRFHPHKDHRTFVDTAARLAARLPEVHFVMCGRGVDYHNVSLNARLAAGGLAGRCSLLGPRQDVPRIMAALDVVVSSSRTEAFSNVLGEALACGVPNVATDVGDARRIIGDCGSVAASGDSAELSRCCAALLRMAPRDSGNLAIRCRRRAEETLALAASAAKHLAIWQRAAGGTLDDLPVRRAA